MWLKLDTLKNILPYVRIKIFCYTKYNNYLGWNNNMLFIKY